MIRPPPNSPLFPYTTLFRSEPPLPEDVDLVFFDPEALQPEREDDVRNRLAALAPNIPWDVKNQAAVHLWYPSVFGIAVEPLRSAEEAVSTWPETATAVAVGLTPGGALRVVAPLGLDDLFGMTWRRNPRRVTVTEYRRRLEKKLNRERWPNVTVAGPV